MEIVNKKVSFDNNILLIQKNFLNICLQCRILQIVDNKRFHRKALQLPNKDITKEVTQSSLGLLIERGDHGNQSEGIRAN